MERLLYSVAKPGRKELNILISVAYFKVDCFAFRMLFLLSINFKSPLLIFLFTEDDGNFTICLITCTKYITFYEQRVDVHN